MKTCDLMMFQDSSPVPINFIRDFSPVKNRKPGSIPENGRGHFEGAHFPKAFSQRAASRATFFGAVPPKLVREATEFSTDSTL